MSEQLIFQSLLSAKRDWAVMPIQNGHCIPGAEKTIQKALEARHLELPVGQWIKECASRERKWLSDYGILLLASNFKDEKKHDSQLNYAYSNISLANLTDKLQIESESRSLVSKWLKMGEKYHPVLVTWVIEQSIFFPVLTLYRRLGGTQLAMVSTEISRDETIHARTNGTIVKLLGLSIPSDLDDLRQETIEWLVLDLDDSGIEDKYGQSQNYIDQSFQLLHQGSYAKFKDTSFAVMPGFFETHRSHLPKYGRVQS